MFETNAVQRKDEATKAFGQALALTVPGMKKMLRYVGALFALRRRLNTMAHNKLDSNIVEFLNDRHLHQGLANHDLGQIEALSSNILWALDLGEGPKPKQGEPAAPVQPFKVTTCIDFT